jgi:DnaJ family protein A protein 5
VLYEDEDDGGSGQVGGGGGGAAPRHTATAADVFRILVRLNGISDYTDAPGGFFAVLRDTFATLADEERRAAAAAAAAAGVIATDYPPFGHAGDAYDDGSGGGVRRFYGAWAAFATKKSFAWKDVYRLPDAPDRRTRRWMEKENRRRRDEGAREYNDAVRALVAFVRKRDPRYVPNRQSEAERQQALRDAAAAQAARSRAANRAKMAAAAGVGEEALPAWARPERGDPADAGGGASGEDDDKGDDDEQGGDAEEGSQAVEEVEEYACVACGKTFKSANQFEVHEESKKHRKAVQQLRRKMLKENKSMSLGDDEAAPDKVAASVNGTDNAAKGSIGDVHDTTQSHKDQRVRAKGSVDGLSQPLGAQTSEDDRRSISSSSMDENRERQHAAGEESLSASEYSDNDYAPREEVENRILGDQNIDQSRATRHSLGRSDEVDDAIPGEEDGDDDYDDDDGGSDEVGKAAKKMTGMSVLPPEDPSDARQQPPSIVREGKAKQRRAKKAAAAAVAATATSSGDAASSSSSFQCVTCKNSFPSRTKLFEHIRSAGHAQPVPNNKTNNSNKGKKKKAR